MPGGDQVIAPLNRCMAIFQARGLPIYATRDWHPADHCSFRSRGGSWPVHCVQGTPGAAFSPALEVPAGAGMISKAMNPERENYSDFEGTELDMQLRAAGVTRVFVGGLATDYCVLNTVRDGGLPGIKIFASGNLDEYRLAEIVAAGAPIDGFGVGTRMNTSADHPYLDYAYKLQEYAGLARRKRSEGKSTWPGRKQVYRGYGVDGRMAGDVLTTVDDKRPEQPLLETVMRDGRRLAGSPPLDVVRAHALAELARLPEALRGLTQAPVYPVTVAEPLRRLAEEVDRRCASAG